MIRKIFILFLFIIIQKSKIIQSKKWTAEELWEKTQENFTKSSPTDYFFSDVENYYSTSFKELITKQLATLAIDAQINPYAFLINNICCGDLKDENFIIEYTNKLSKLINKDFGKLNDKKTLIFLIIYEENIFKINIIGSSVKKVVKDEDVKKIYDSVKRSLSNKNYYNTITEVCTNIGWIYANSDTYEDDDDDDKIDEEIDKKEREEKERKEKEEKERKEREEKEKKEKEEKKEKNNNNDNLNNDKNNGNSILIVIIIVLIFAFCLVLLSYFKMCKRVKILSSEKINFNPYEKLND